MSASLRVSNLSYAYPDGRAALDGVTLSVEAGERVAILGPNGAGKTTLMLHLNGILASSSGEVEVGGLPVTDDNLREIRRRVGLVFQDPDDQLFMATVADDVAFGPANLGIEGDDLATCTARALAAVGMSAEANVAPHHLSFGQRRRVALATVLSMDPQVLVLDEPTSNLDPAARRELADVLRASELTTLIVTHDLLYALELCPRSVVMCEGRVLADGPTAELLADEPLMAKSRLGLPVGVDRRLLRPPHPSEDHR